MYTTHLKTGKRDIALTIRTTKQERNLIDQAAKRLGVSRTDFLLESACREAQDVLLDTTYFGLDAKGFKKFCDLLDAPPQSLERVRRLLKTKAPWE
ncbi:MAG: DUF1778 domain-containing protein [Burkholderiales bacterium]